jgi:hypothetical protein
MQKLEPEKEKTGACKHANPGHRKIEKPEPEKMHASGARKCKNRSPKKRKTGARKDAHPGHRKVEKPEPEK